nr:DUF892 family protein [Halomonas sp. IOP_31]
MVERQRSLRDSVAIHGLLEELLSQGGILLVGDHPGHDEAALQVQYHVESEVDTQGGIARYDESSSSLKDATGRMSAMGQAVGGMFSGDEIVKGCIASYTFEQLEISSYKVLIATAEEAGDMETKRVCEEILEEELAMAAWLDEHMPKTLRQYLQRDEDSSATAKR